MMLKIYMTWLVIYDVDLSWKPLITGLPSIWVVFCLIEWFASKRKLAAYMTVNLLLTTVFFAAIMYYKYYGVIVTYHALQQVNQVTEVKGSVFSLADPYFLLIYVDIVVLTILWFAKKRSPIWSAWAKKPKKRSMVMAAFVISLTLCLSNIWPNRAIMNELRQAEEMGILNYEAHKIFEQQEVEYMDPKSITHEAIQKLKGIQDPAAPNFHKAAAGRNVIIIQMESMQSFLLGYKLDGLEITPVMNELMREHLYFPAFYQQVGQGNTSDAEFVVNTSFYIPPNGAASQVYADKDLPSLPKVLEKNGYQTATFHTNGVEFWNREEMYTALGFDHYYDQQFFGDEDLLMFGASDEVLYNKTVDKLIEMRAAGKPFYAHVISMTAHHPYNMAEEKLRIELPKRFKDTLVGDYISSQNYSDYALGLFIKRLKESGLWDESLIVIYGDHLGLAKYMLNHHDKKLMKEIFGRKYGYPDMLNIPLIIAAPGILDHTVHEQLGGQVDILPTIANLTGASLEDHPYFGQDLLNQTYNLLPERYYLPSGSFINNEAVFVPQNGFNDGTEYPLDPKQGKKKAKVTKDEYERALKLLHMSDSYVN
ncbi:MAG TPA: LTA synthase family protein, partial [Bacilli bacterium]